jgi:hypothetical protein
MRVGKKVSEPAAEREEFDEGKRGWERRLTFGTCRQWTCPFISFRLMPPGEGVYELRCTMHKNNNITY